MSRYYGMLIVCDRCHGRMFLEAAGEDEYDGGWTTVKKTAKIPEDWGTNVQVGNEYVDLCPKCVKEFNRICDNYMNDCKTFMKEGEAADES